MSAESANCARAAMTMSTKQAAAAHDFTCRRSVRLDESTSNEDITWQRAEIPMQPRAIVMFASASSTAAFDRLPCATQAQKKTRGRSFEPFRSFFTDGFLWILCRLRIPSVSLQPATKKSSRLPGVGLVRPPQLPISQPVQLTFSHSSLRSLPPLQYCTSARQ
jgi:hypothetical protein